MLPVALVPPVEDLGGDEDGGEGRGDDADKEGEGDVVQLAAAEHPQRERREEGRGRRHDRAGEDLADGRVDDVLQGAGRIELQLLPNAVEDDHRLVDGVARHAEDGRDHGRGELVAGEHEDADVHQDVVQGGRHGADAEAELEAEGDVDEDDEHRDAHGFDGVPLDLLADGGADLARALLDQARVRVGLLQGGEELLGLAVGGLKLELFAAGAEVADVGRVDLAGAGRVGHLADLRAVDLSREGGGDLVAAGKVDAVDAVALVEDVAEADRHEGDRADGGGFAPLDEIHVEVAQHAAHGHLLERAGLDQHLHEHVAGDEDGEQGRDDADQEGEAEALDRAGAEPDHDAADEQLHQVGVHDGREGLAEAALVGADQVLAEGDLLAHALEDQDVRVHRHADGEHDAGEAGQRHGGADAGHDAQDDDDVHRERGDGDDAAGGVEGDHERGHRGRANDGGAHAAGDGVRGERGPDLILLLDLERHAERIVEHVGEVDGLALGEGAGDLGAAAVDLLADGRGGVELAVEHDGEAAQTAGALAFVGDGLGDVGELLAAGVGELEDDAEAAELIHGRIGIGHALAGHLGAALDVEFLGVALAGAAALLVEGHALVARGGLLRRRDEGMNHLEIEARGQRQGPDDLGIVLGRDAGQLDLDAVLTDRADDGLGDAEAVDAVADDLDRLGELFLAHLLVVGADGIGVDLQGEGDAALQVEAELQLAFGAAEQLVEQDVVALLDVGQRRFEADLGEELRQVELPLEADLLEGDVDAGGPARLDAGVDLAHELGELGGLGGGFLFDVVAEGLVLQRQDGEHGPQHEGRGQRQFPEMTTEHGYLVVKLDWAAGAWGGTRPPWPS